jgi:GAF domain
MAQPNPDVFREIVMSAVALDGIESAAVFVLRPGSSELRLAAAAGVEGPPLEGLKTAVRNPAHPIARTVVDGFATFDAVPMAPGGPALRSHLPLTHDDGTVVGVLAVAHDQSLDAETRESLERLAGTAPDRSMNPDELA